MTLLLHQIVPIAMRLAIVCATHGVTNAIVDAIAPLFERFLHLSFMKTLVAILVVASLVAFNPSR